MGRGLSQQQRDILLHLGENDEWLKASEIAHALGRTQPSTKKPWSKAKVIPPADRVIVHKALERLCARGLVEKMQREWLGSTQTGYKITDAGAAYAESLDAELPERRQRHQEAQDAYWEQIGAWHQQHTPGITANYSQTKSKS